MGESILRNQLLLYRLREIHKFSKATLYSVVSGFSPEKQFSRTANIQLCAHSSVGSSLPPFLPSILSSVGSVPSYGLSAVEGMGPVLGSVRLDCEMNQKTALGVRDRCHMASIRGEK